MCFVCIGKNNKTGVDGWHRRGTVVSFWDNSCNLVFEDNVYKCVQLNEHRTFIWYLLSCVMAKHSWFEMLDLKCKNHGNTW